MKRVVSACGALTAADRLPIARDRGSLRWQAFRPARGRGRGRGEPAGTAGALLNAADRLDETFFLLNGDLVLRLQLALAGDHRDRPDWTMHAALATGIEGSRYGRVQLDRTAGCAASRRRAAASEPINAGIYLVKRRVLDRHQSGPLLARARDPAGVDRLLAAALGLEGKPRTRSCACSRTRAMPVASAACTVRGRVGVVAKNSQLKSKYESPFGGKNVSSSRSAALSSAPAVPAGFPSATTSTGSPPKCFPA